MVQTVLLIFTFFQINITSQMWPSGGGRGKLLTLAEASLGRSAFKVTATAAASMTPSASGYTASINKLNIRLQPLLILIGLLEKQIIRLTGSPDKTKPNICAEVVTSHYCEGPTNVDAWKRSHFRSGRNENVLGWNVFFCSVGLVD